MQFSLNAQAGGQVVELGGVPDGPAALNIVPDGHLAGPAALVAWASCLEHRDQHLQKLVDINIIRMNIRKSSFLSSTVI